MRDIGRVITQAVILVGGQGTRLGPLTTTVPKPMLQCGDRPFLAWILRELCRYGITETLLLAGHLAPVIEAAVPALIARLPRPMRVRVLTEPSPAGTGGALVHARPALADRFLLLNGDSWLDTPLSPLVAGPAGNMLVHRVPDGSRFGRVTLQDGAVRSFAEKAGPGPALVNAGVYALGRGMLDGVGAHASLEHDRLPGLAQAGALRATIGTGLFVDIGLPSTLAQAQTVLPAVLRRPALFLDRDGVINHDHGYVGTIDRFDLIDGALDAIADATRAGWHVFVVTNQSGIARGHYDVAAFEALMRHLLNQVLAAGGTIDDVRYCPTHPEAPLPQWRRESDWRKPAPGMILDLIARWELDPANCLLVGDQPSDLAAAAAAGVQGQLFPGGNLQAFLRPLLTRPANNPNQRSAIHSL